jgi:hypothetical protein
MEDRDIILTEEVLDSFDDERLMTNLTENRKGRASVHPGFCKLRRAYGSRL